jgi:cation:H+ antiporter
MIDPGSLTPEAARAHALKAVWTFPAVLFSAFVVGWGAEAAQFLVSQGLALALLAWLQTLPEFAVEAVIAWHRDVPLMTANFTGSLRLLTGLAWPMIFVVSFGAERKRRPRRFVEHTVALSVEHSVGVVALLPPILWFYWVWAKGSLSLVDSAVLLLMYAFYLVTLRKIPPQDEEEVLDLPRIPRAVLGFGAPWNGLAVLGLFGLGGLILYYVTPVFLDSMLGLSALLGVSSFVFVQWVSPFLSEFPEKVTAFAWSRKEGHAGMALMNMVSSNLNQWTVLAAMIPIVYAISLGHPQAIAFDQHQRAEILLTLAQGTLGFLLLVNLEFNWLEATGLFVLWLVQFAIPASREVVTFVYFAWCGLELLRIMKGGGPWTAFRAFPHLWRHGRPDPGLPLPKAETRQRG